VAQWLLSSDFRATALRHAPAALQLAMDQLFCTATPPV